MSEHREHLLSDTEGISCRGALTVRRRAARGNAFTASQDRYALAGDIRLAPGAPAATPPSWPGGYRSTQEPRRPALPGAGS